MRCLTRQVLCVVAGLLVAGVAEAQDQRNVLEPVIPAVCTTLNFFVAPIVDPQFAVLSRITMTVGSPAVDAAVAE